MIDRGRLIFGCVSLTMHPDKNSALNILNEAFEQGIYHFDVARLYGMGHAESLLGDFIKDKRDKVLITTKCGLNPEEASLPNIGTGNLLKVKKIINHIPFLNNTIRRIMSKKNTSNGNSLYHPEEIKNSLQKSLNSLKTDYIDYLLLHEATIKDAQDTGLIECFDHLKKTSIIKTGGIGSDFSLLKDNNKEISDTYQILQFEDSLINPNLDLIEDRNKIFFTHSIFKHLSLIKTKFQSQNLEVKKLESLIDKDLSLDSNICALILKWSLERNKKGKVLFSTQHSHKLKSNLAIADNIILNEDSRDLLKQLFKRC